MPPLYPCWRHPVIAARDVSSAAAACGARVEDDLLARFAAALVTPDDQVSTEVRRAARDAPPIVVAHRRVRVEPELDTGPDLAVPTGGPRAALVFADSAHVCYIRSRSCRQARRSSSRSASRDVSAPAHQRRVQAARGSSC
ncbi:MAG: hypothetical protein U1E76_19400 [Planctomycetota bacterium]